MAVYLQEADITRRENQIPTAILEGAPAQEAESDLESVASPTQPSNLTLTNNPAFNATTQQSSDHQSIQSTESFITAVDSQATESTGAAFAQAFG